MPTFSSVFSLTRIQEAPGASWQHVSMATKAAESSSVKLSSVRNSVCRDVSVLPHFQPNVQPCSRLLDPLAAEEAILAQILVFQPARPV